MNGIKVGFALCGSFCTISSAIAELYKLKSAGADIYPIASDVVMSTNTRFGKAADIVDEIETVCGKRIISTIESAEPIGPKKLLDIVVISPATGNTIGKLACGITDTAVTMAAKAHLRNERPLLIAPATNDALGTSAKNIGLLMNIKNIYFVPFSQDDPHFKPNSCIADFTKIPEAILSALVGKQLEPVIC